MFEQGQNVVAKRKLETGAVEKVYGKVDSAPNDGLWVTWDTDFAWAHRNLFIPRDTELYKNIKAVNE